jgi:hypothetical protein
MELLLGIFMKNKNPSNSYIENSSRSDRNLEAIFPGKVINLSNKPLWVVETETGSAIAHKLEAQFQSPDNIDCDGVKTISGELISGHASWWKLRDSCTVKIIEQSGNLMIDCKCKLPLISCSPVAENEFGNVTFSSTQWGVPI